MDFIELQLADDLQKLKELVSLEAYNVKLIKIIYNPAIFTLRDIEDVQHFIEKYFQNVPITFEENLEKNNISISLGVD